MSVCIPWRLGCAVVVWARVRAEPDTQPRGRCGVGDKDESRQLTGILRIMQGRSQDLEGTGKVQEVELGMQGKENLNWLVCHCGRLTGHLWQRVWCWVGEEEECGLMRVPDLRRGCSDAV